MERLKTVFNPRGGAWIEGRDISSILTAIGGVIAPHLIAIGVIGGAGLGPKPNPWAAPRSALICPHCGSATVRMIEGCMTCADCGHSECD